MASQTFNDDIHHTAAHLLIDGSTSGSTALRAQATASGTLTVPAATDTLVAKQTTDTLVNKTLDTAAPNTVKINGTQVSDVTGTGKVVLDTSPSLTTPNVGVATATSVNKVAITAPATSATLTIANGKTATFSNSIVIAGVDNKTATFNNSLAFAGTDGTTLTFQGTDTYIGRTTTDTLTNKTFDTAGTGNVFKINSTQVSSQATLNAFAHQGQIYVTLPGANLNVTTDQAITIPLPTGTTLYQIAAIFVSNPSAAVTTAVGGVWSGAGKSGTTIVGSGAAGVALSGLTATGANNNGNMIPLTVNNVNTQAFNFTTLFFACSTAEGSARTADVTVIIRPLN